MNKQIKNIKKHPLQKNKKINKHSTLLYIINHLQIQKEIFASFYKYIKSKTSRIEKKKKKV